MGTASVVDNKCRCHCKKGYVTPTNLIGYDDCALGFHEVTQGGSTLGFTLPATVFAGYSTDLRNRAQNPTGIEWLYAEPPSVSSVLRDRSSVTVKLIGEIR